MKAFLSVILALLLGSSYSEMSDMNDETTAIYEERAGLVSSFWNNLSAGANVTDVLAQFNGLSSGKVFGTPQTYMYTDGMFLVVEEGQTPSGIQITVTTDNIAETLAEVSELPYAYVNILVHGDRSAIEFYVVLEASDE